jgi:hypothetical protein
MVKAASSRSFPAGRIYPQVEEDSAAAKLLLSLPWFSVVAADLLKDAIPGFVANENRPSGAEARADIDELSGTTKVVPFPSKSNLR